MGRRGGKEGDGITVRLRRRITKTKQSFADVLLSKMMGGTCLLRRGVRAFLNLNLMTYYKEQYYSGVPVLFFFVGVL